MAKTAAERQRKYRASRQFAGDNGKRRVSAYVSTRAALALHRLAESCSVTKRDLLKKLLIEKDEEVLKGLNPDTPERKKYLGESD